MVIKVVTFNIHHGTDMNNRPRLREIYNLLKQINPDIINLQEVDMLRPQTAQQKQAFILAQRLGMRYVYGPVRLYEQGSYGNAILSRYPIVESNNIKLEDDKDVRFCLQANIRLNNKLVSIYNTHLGLSQPKRYQQLINDILPQILPLNYPALLAGDFNAPATRPEIIMLNSLLSDTYLKNSGLYQYTFPAHNPSARIDYIFVNKHVTPIDYYIVDTNVSDHLPVVTVLEI